MLRRLLLALALLWPAAAFAQSNVPIYQTGLITPGHLPVWTTNGVVQDDLQNGQYTANAFGITALGLPFCINDAITTNPGGYHQFCMGSQVTLGGHTGMFFTYNAYGGATSETPWFNINGTNYEFPFVLSGIVGPGTTVVGDVALWNNTQGTLLQDGGLPTYINPQRYGVVYGGTDPNGTNAADMEAAIAAAAALSPSQATSSPTVSCGGNIVGLSGTFQIANAYNVALEKCAFLPVGTPSWTVGAGSTGSYTYYTTAGGAITAAVWVPPDPFSGTLPVGMVDIASTATKTTLRDIAINCQYQTNCSDLTNNGDLTTVINPNFSQAYAYGIFYTSVMNLQGGNISGGGDPTKWTGYGLYCAGGRLSGTTVDSQTAGPIINNYYENFVDDQKCGDFKFQNAHTWIGGTGTSTFGEVQNGINGVVEGGGVANVLGNTFDCAPVYYRTAAGTGNYPQIVFSKNVFETCGTGMDADFVLQCTGGGTCGSNLSNVNQPVTFTDPLPSLTTVLNYHPYTMEDSSGNYNPQAWAMTMQSILGSAGNIVPEQYSHPRTNLITQAPTTTFTGNIANAANLITAASILPAPGTAVTDSGGCLAANTTLITVSWPQSEVFISNATAPTCSSSGDTLTIGTLTLTGNVVSGSYQINITSNTAWFDVSVQLTDSASCLPSGAYITGWNVYTGKVLFQNDAGQTSSCAHTNDTFTATPSAYYITALDSGTMFPLNNGSSNVNFYLPSSMIAATMRFALNSSHANTVAMNLLGSGATINNWNGLSSVSLAEAGGIVDTLTSINTSPAGYSLATHLPPQITDLANLPTNCAGGGLNGDRFYIINQNGAPTYHGSLTGGGTTRTIAACIGGSWVSD